MLRRRRVLLGGLVQLPHRLIDLANAGGLLIRGGGDFAHQVRRAANRRHNPVQQLASALGLAHGVAGHRANFSGRHLAALGQLAHLRRHHGKALAMLASAGGLNRCVQGQ